MSEIIQDENREAIVLRGEQLEEQIRVMQQALIEQSRRINDLRAALRQSDEALNQMLIWMPSGFAPQSQANAMRLAYEARKVIARTDLAEAPSDIMAASEKAAEVVSSWSDAKKDYVGRAVPSTLAERQDK